MLSRDPRNNGYMSLPNWSVQSNEVMEYEELGCIEAQDTTSQFRRTLIWAVCSATAMYTTKRLMVDNNFHYPLTIAFGVFLILFILYASMGLLDNISVVWNRFRRKDSQLSLNPFGTIPNGYWTEIFPASLATSFSYPLLLEAVLHMPNLSVLIMLYPLVYAIEDTILRLYSIPRRNMKGSAWTNLTIISASCIVLYNESRLEVPGLVFGILGLLFLVLGRACCVLGFLRPAVVTQAGCHSFVQTTLVVGTAINGLCALYLENIQATKPPPAPLVALIILDLVALVGTAVSGTSIIAYMAVPLHGKPSKSSHNDGLLASVGSGVLLLFMTICSNRPYIVSIQLAAYLTANVSLLGFNRMNTLALSVSDIMFSLRKSTENTGRGKPSYSFSIFTSTILCVVVWLLLAFASSLATSTLPLGNPTIYDRSYIPLSRFDIVVSMYAEDPTSVKDMLHQIKTTSLLRFLDYSNHTPRVIIYTKNPDTDLDSLKQTTGADSVERLENVGREGGTYLSHITKNWNYLAEQTMFIQAHAHNQRELIPRINDYLVEDTGMLSLGFTGVTCSCGSCGDRWGWEDPTGTIPVTYQKIYGKSCDPSQRILLSYKGQFVASARRIRGIEQEVYAELLRSVTKSDGEREIGGATGNDTPSNPYFGFTMERMWNLVMQCATNEWIATRCPSLLSGMGFGGVAQDCQCLDELG